MTPAAPPTTSQLLATWEHAVTQSPAERATALLAAAAPEIPATELDALTVGDREARLLSMREALFGPDLTGVADCPQCGRPVELTFVPRDHFIPSADPQSSRSALALAAGGYRLSFRLPTGADLMAVSRHADPSSARLDLLDRCLLEALYGAERVRAAHLPADVVSAVAGAMADADDHGDVRLATTCPTCGHRWETLLDVGTYLWAEVDAWSRRLLREVALLARTYGWGEADVLAMTPQRRRLYSELAQQ